MVNDDDNDDNDDVDDDDDDEDSLSLAKAVQKTNICIRLCCELEVKHNT